MKDKTEINISKGSIWKDYLKERYFKTFENFILETEKEIGYEAGEMIYYNDIEEDASENKRYDEIVKEVDVEYGGLMKDNLPADFIYSDSGLEVRFVS